MAGQQYKCKQGHYVAKQYNGKICPTCRTMLARQKGRKAPDQNVNLNPNMHDASGVARDLKMKKAYENYQKNHSHTTATPIAVETKTAVRPETAVKTSASVQPKKGIVKKISERRRVNAVIAVTNSKDLAKYVLDDSPVVRAHVAVSPYANSKMVNYLAKDPDPTVRGATALSPKLSVDTIKHLAIDPDPYVRKHVAYNVSGATPLMRKMVLHFYTDTDSEVRAAICSNPRTHNMVKFLKENPHYTTGYAHRYSRYIPQPNDSKKTRPQRPNTVRGTRGTPTRRQKARPRTTKMLVLMTMMRMAFSHR